MTKMDVLSQARKPIIDTSFTFNPYGLTMPAKYLAGVDEFIRTQDTTNIIRVTKGVAHDEHI